jgi:hypothetical protein
MQWLDLVICCHKDNMKFTEEQRDLLREFAASDVSKVVISVLDQLQQEQLESILKMPLPSTSDRDLLIAKARAEGAAKIISDVRLFLERIKKRS